MTVWRLNTNGSLDTTFNSVGYVTHNNAAGGNSHDAAHSAKVLSDGRIIITGYSRNSTNEDMAMWRYNSNGTLDTTFNSLGYFTHDNAAGGTGADRAYDIAAQYDGKYIVTGRSYNGSNYDMALWVYETLYQIANLGGTYDVTYNNEGIEVGQAQGVYGNESLRLEETDGTPLADVVTTMDQDRDWSVVSGDSDDTEYESYVEGLTSAPGTASTMSLYIPYRDGDNAVGICPL